MKTKILPRLLPTLLAVLCAALSFALPSRAWAHDDPHDDRHDGRTHAPPPGRITVVNHAGARVTVGLIGQPGRSLPAWESTTLTVPQSGHGPAETTLRATYTQFGVERTLQSNRLAVAPGRTEQITLAAERVARILVTNRARLDVQLVVDGKPSGSFAPGAARVVTLPTGSPELIMTAAGRVIARTRIELRPFAEPSWTVDIPHTGELLVRNPLPIPVELVSDRGLTRTVQAHGQVIYADLPLGAFHLTARRLTGEFIDTVATDVRIGQTVTWSVDAPTTGFVDLTSHHFLAAEVRIDGRSMVTLDANGTARSRVTVGWHEVVVTDVRGVAVSQGWVEVKPFEAARMSFGTPAHVEARGRHDRDASHDRRHDGRVDRRDDRGAAVAEAGESCGLGH